jgi:hypothetical protein
MSFSFIENAGVGSSINSGSITPQSASDYFLIISSAVGISPVGSWVNTWGTSYFFAQQVTNTDPVNFVTTHGGSNNPWVTLLLDFTSTGHVIPNPSYPFGVSMDFGTGATQTINITPNSGDTLVLTLPCPTTEGVVSPFGPLTVTDDQGNVWIPLGDNPTSVFSSAENSYAELWVFVASNVVGFATTITLTLANWSAELAPNGLLVALENVAPIPPTIFAQVTPSSIQEGQSATVSWVATNAVSVSSPQFGSLAVSGSEVVSPDTSQVYQFTATGPGPEGSAGTASTQVELLVNGIDAAFSLQKIILSLKQDRIPNRGRNN